MLKRLYALSQRLQERLIAPGASFRSTEHAPSNWQMLRDACRRALGQISSLEGLSHDACPHYLGICERYSQCGKKPIVAVCP
jgi:hypothetical protein